MEGVVFQVQDSGCYNSAVKSLLEFCGMFTQDSHSQDDQEVQDNWDLWLHASVFTYNTTVSSSAGVTPNSMFSCDATLPVDWVYPTPSVEKRTMFY